jgi:hypothetical protein
MKWKIFLATIAAYAIKCSSLRQVKELNPLSVKSPGGLDNIAPEAKSIISPEYASMNIKIYIFLKYRRAQSQCRTPSLISRSSPKKLFGRPFTIT